MGREHRVEITLWLGGRGEFGEEKRLGSIGRAEWARTSAEGGNECQRTYLTRPNIYAGGIFVAPCHGGQQAVVDGRAVPSIACPSCLANTCVLSWARLNALGLSGGCRDNCSGQLGGIWL